MQSSCKKSGGDDVPQPPAPVNQVDFWLTKGDQSALLEKQTSVLSFGNVYNSYNSIEVDTAQAFQAIDGFGYALTGGSAYLINRMGTAQSAALLNEVFGNGSNGIGVSYIRIGIGASDLSASVYSYNDMPAGQTDPT
ncbi:MAG TPA: glucosylceramidase, partial [Chitinophagaceae bacterium]|nr:glucosylceramidase [Chitinophagaceae bacterium]